MPNTINFSKFIIFIITRNKYSYSPQTVILAELPYYEPLRNFYSHESMKQVFRLFERKKVIINNTAVILTSEVLLYDFSTSFEAPGYAPTIVLIQFFSLKNIGRNYLLEVSIDTVIVEHRTGNEDITCCGIIKLDCTPTLFTEAPKS